MYIKLFPIYTCIYTYVHKHKSVYTKKQHVYIYSVTHGIPSVAHHWNSWDPLTCTLFSTKEPLNVGHFCGKWPIKMRDPMSLGHPVSDHSHRRLLFRYVYMYLYICIWTHIYTNEKGAYIYIPDQPYRRPLYMLYIYLLIRIYIRTHV